MKAVNAQSLRYAIARHQGQIQIAGTVLGEKDGRVTISEVRLLRDGPFELVYHVPSQHVTVYDNATEVADLCSGEPVARAFPFTAMALA